MVGYRLISQAVNERSVQCTIIIDDELAMKESSHKAAEALEALQSAGAKIFKVKRMHNKTLIHGYNSITEGSFNWLSATRNPDSQYNRHEVSWKISGSNAKQAIEIAIKEFSKLGVKIDLPDKSTVEMYEY